MPLAYEIVLQELKEGEESLQLPPLCLLQKKQTANQDPRGIPRVPEWPRNRARAETMNSHNAYAMWGVQGTRCCCRLGDIVADGDASMHAVW